MPEQTAFVCSYCNLPHRLVDDPEEMCDVCYESMMDARRDALEYIDLDDDYDIEESEEEE